MSLNTLLNKVSSPIQIQNHHFFHKYETFIDTLKNYTFSENDLLEKHHILPRSLFPELEKDPGNIIRISARTHYLCHWLLAKAYGGPMWFAFNQMRRVIPGQQKTSVLFELARTYISQQISLANTGKVHTQEFREAISARYTGTVNARLSDNTVIRVAIDDPRFETGEIKNARIGHIHTEVTKYEIGKGLRDKQSYVRDDGVMRYFADNETIPEGFTLGFIYSPPKEKKSWIWAHNLNTQKDTHWPKDKPLPEGWVLGRKNGPGFKHVNDPSTRKVLDLVTKQFYQEANALPLKPNCVLDLGQRLDCIRFIKKDNYLITSNETLNDFLHANGYPLPKQASIKDFESLVIASSNGYNNPLVKQFTKLHQGKTPKDLGFQFIAFSNFVWHNDMIIWRNTNSRQKRKSRRRKL